MISRKKLSSLCSDVRGFVSGQKKGITKDFKNIHRKNIYFPA
jgi:hypothetical protein